MISLPKSETTLTGTGGAVYLTGREDEKPLCQVADWTVSGEPIPFPVAFGDSIERIEKRHGKKVSEIELSQDGRCFTLTFDDGSRLETTITPGLPPTLQEEWIE